MLVKDYPNPSEYPAKTSKLEVTVAEKESTWVAAAVVCMDEIKII